MKNLGFLLVLIFAFSTHSQVETLAGHSFFRDQEQQPGFSKSTPVICDVGYKKDSAKISFGKKLKKHFAQLFEAEFI